MDIKVLDYNDYNTVFYGLVQKLWECTFLMSKYKVDFGMVSLTCWYPLEYEFGWSSSKSNHGIMHREILL